MKLNYNGEQLVNILTQLSLLIVINQKNNRNQFVLINFKIITFGTQLVVYKNQYKNYKYYCYFKHYLLFIFYFFD